MSQGIKLYEEIARDDTERVWHGNTREDHVLDVGGTRAHEYGIKRGRDQDKLQGQHSNPQDML